MQKASNALTSKSQPSVFIVDGDRSVIALFHKFGWKINGTIEESDLIQFTGGADISPAIYNQIPHPTSGWSEQRDRRELLAYALAKKLDKPMAGICRGGQLLNVLCGGDMWQNVDSHGMSHNCIDLRTHVNYEVSSLHHQMMIPGVGAEVIAIAHESTRRERMSKVGEARAKFSSSGMTNDPEVIWYPKERCFCFQGHPEYSIVPSVATVYMDYIQEFYGFSR